MVIVYVNQINQALEQGLYFPALALALALPDICAYAEYPDMEDKVGQRYISWYDKYIGHHFKEDAIFPNSPCLSGELVYNLRNTYLHQGSPNVDANKIKEENNQIDRFVLVLGDGRLHTLTMNVSTGPVNVRMITIDVTFLCRLICECALSYYRDNMEKFRFNFSIATEEELFGKKSPLDNLSKDDDPIGDLILKKLHGENHTKRFETNITQHMVTQIKSGNYTRIDPINKKVPLNGNDRKPAPNKEEQRFRSFFGRTFPEKKFKEKKEQIIDAVLHSETRLGLNNRLMKIMPGEDVKEVLKRLKPFIKDWPGQ